MTRETTPREALRELIDQRCLITDTAMTLSTGTQSSFYFDCKRAMLDGQTLSLIADAFLEEIDRLEERPAAIGGLTLGADFITAAVAMRAYQLRHPTAQGSIVRKEPKKHGTRNHIENELPPGTRIVVIDDVITSGSSIQRAAEQFLAAGYKIVGIVALVDRQAGGAEQLAKTFQCPVRVIFKKSDFPRINADVSAIPHAAVNA